MISYFFVNPVAGQGKGIERFIADIKASAEALSMQYEIYITKAEGDGENCRGKKLDFTLVAETAL